MPHSKTKPSILLIGCGNMGSAMLQGWQKNDVYTHCDIVDPSVNSTHVETKTTSCFPSINEVEKMHSDIVIFAVKPQIIDHVLTDYTQSTHQANMYISIAAGVTTTSLANHLGKEKKIIRCMPNTPASISAGVMAMYSSPSTNDEDKDAINSLMSALGEVVWLAQEDDMHSITALSGSGPAYVFHFIECLEQIALDQGLSKENAKLISRQTVVGAALLAKVEYDIDIETLRQNVTSPGGTTEAGLKSLMSKDNQNLKTLLEKTINRAKERSVDLSEN
tara:strand:- start:2746 stop:3576 length:831 start_codon:yes stop_codon:yes gene_type:complete